MKTIITFGEIMGRFETQRTKKLIQSLPGSLELTFGGAEGNVAASLAMMGKQTRFVTALPQNDLGEACLRFLKGFGIDTSSIQRRRERLGLYFLETGANQLGSSVTYDRAESAMCHIDSSKIDWVQSLAEGEWFHTTGITPSISHNAAAATLTAVKTAKERGLTVSCDLNFRKKLWLWDEKLSPKELAQKTMREILPYVDVVIANEEDAFDILGIEAEQTDITTGKIETQSYLKVAEEIARQFPQVQKVAITLRESLSASHNNWGALLYDAQKKEHAFAPTPNGSYQPYEIKNIVDRVGGGDSFGAGLIFALTTPEWQSLEKAVSYAVAASCLAHSLPGDINYVTRQEVEKLAGGDSSGRVSR